MIKSFFASRKWALWAYGGAFIIIIALVYQTHLNVAINNWYKDRRILGWNFEISIHRDALCAYIHVCIFFCEPLGLSMARGDDV